MDNCSLFSDRHHGAESQKGWEFQILVSALYALKLLANPDDDLAIRLEGIEDLDVLVAPDVTAAKHLMYVQAKTSGTNIGWGIMADVLSSFVEDAFCRSDAEFLLITDAPLTGKALDCARFRDPHEVRSRSNTLKSVFFVIQKRLTGRVAVTPDLVSHVLEHMRVEKTSAEAQTASAKKIISERYGFGEQESLAYLTYMRGELFHCAKDRQTVSRSTLDQWKARFDLAAQHVHEMTAIQQHLVQDMKWSGDCRPSDFTEGKQTRPGHVFDNLDVVRTKWLDEIDESFHTNDAVVIRAPSGEGKSTLAFRYALTRWSGARVVQVMGAATEGDARAVGDYLRTLTTVCPDVCVLIDNADGEMLHWPIVVSACQAAGIQSITTIRTEDWHRQARPDMSSVTVVEPRLDKNEATQLFAQLQERRLVRGDEQTAEGAYEQIGPSGLLMEFIYFATHGTMLRDRLDQQVRAISGEPNSDETLWLLEKVALSSVLGCSLDRSNLLGQDEARAILRTQLLKSLNGEYLISDQQTVRGLHMLRSSHLLEVLGESSGALAGSALSLLSLVPVHEVRRLVYLATTDDRIDRQAFLDGLPATIMGRKPSVMSSVLDALFDTGERSFVEANLLLFGSARDLLGSQGPEILQWFISPVDGTRIADEMEGAMTSSDAPYWQLKDMASRLNHAERGEDYCLHLLQSLACLDAIRVDVSDIAGTGRLLAWCGTLGFASSAIAEHLPGFLDEIQMSSVSTSDLASLSTGLFRYDIVLHATWMQKHADELLLSYLVSEECATACLEDNYIAIEFVIGDSPSESLNDQAVHRLGVVRHLFPQCKEYRSQGIWTDSLAKTVSLSDSSCKAMPAANLVLDIDLQRTRSLMRAVWSCFAPASDAAYLQAWATIREQVLTTVRKITGVAGVMLQTGNPDRRVFGLPAQAIRLFLFAAPSATPEQSADYSTSLLRAPPENHWANELDALAFNLYQVAAGDSTRTNFVLMCAVRLLQKLESMQASLDRRSILPSERTPLLAKEEAAAYLDMLRALRATLTDFPVTPVHSAAKYIVSSSIRAAGLFVQKCRTMADRCQARGVTVVLPVAVNLDAEFVSVPLAVRVTDMTRFWKDEGHIVLTQIESVFDQTDMLDVWLVPIVDGATVDDNAYEVIPGIARSDDHPRLMTAMPASVRALLPVPSGKEPTTMVALGAVFSAVSCLATLIELLSVVQRVIEEDRYLHRCNKASLAAAVDEAADNYRYVLRRDLTWLQTDGPDELVAGMRIADVADFLEAVLNLLDDTQAKDDPARWLVAARAAFDRIPSVEQRT